MPRTQTVSGIRRPAANKGKSAVPPAMDAGGQDNIVQQVCAELNLGAAGYPDLSAVSVRLRTSSRTLKRHLQQHGTSFQQLLDQARHRDALRLLQNPDLEIRQIAAALGYQDPPSFTRAFRRWAGQTPLQSRAASTDQPR